MAEALFRALGAKLKKIEVVSPEKSKPIPQAVNPR
jgi:hypothetical protein